MLAEYELSRHAWNVDQDESAEDRSNAYDRHMPQKNLAAVQLGMCILAAISAGAQVDVLTQHNDNHRQA
jgi:hypothetical protein